MHLRRIFQRGGSGTARSDCHFEDDSFSLYSTVGRTLARHELHLLVVETTSWEWQIAKYATHHTGDMMDGIYRSNSGVDKLQPPHESDSNPEANGVRGERIYRYLLAPAVLSVLPVSSGKASSTNDQHKTSYLHTALHE
jgi:hypothetical protein